MSRRLLLSAVAVAAIGVGIAAPGLLSTVKAEGYYGGVDIVLVGAPVTVPARAGRPFEMRYVVANQGDIYATGVQLAFANNDTLTHIETRGCVEDPVGYPNCALRTPVAAGETARVTLIARVDRNARGAVKLVANASSDAQDAHPGSEFNATAIDITGN